MATTTSSVPSRLLPSVQVGGRLESLDVFRGLTIAGMMLVNNAGNREPSIGPLNMPSGMDGLLRT